jgi:hypothetical protein
MSSQGPQETGRRERNEGLGPATPRGGVAMRDAGAEVMIRTLWIELADQAGATKAPDTMAAAALAGMGCGLAVG